jgi:hypothetical protein
MRTVMSSRSEVPEITGLQASQVNRDLETFNNNVSNVFQIRADGTLASHRIMAQPPFDAETDWIRNDAPCGIGAKER